MHPFHKTSQNAWMSPTAASLLLLALAAAIVLAAAAFGA